MQRNFNTIYNEVIQILDDKLPEYLTYHCTAHTKYVIKKAAYIGEKEGVSEHELFLIKVAALYHDIGFIDKYEDHEEVGCKIAKKALSRYGFSKREINQIEGMIMATKIPQEPRNHLEKIIADADLEYLATKHFKKVGDLLYEELKHFNSNLTKKAWDEIQIKFLKNHHYHTKYCKHYKEHRKRKNLKLLMGSYDTQKK